MRRKGEPMKLDDVDWHIESQPNEAQASIHIALVYCWLAGRGYIELEKDEWNDWPTIFASKKYSPSDFFLKYADGKLITDDVNRPEISDFLEQWYQETYLASDLLPGLQRDEKIDAPYNLLNSWDNVQKAGELFDAALKDYTKQ